MYISKNIQINKLNGNAREDIEYEECSLVTWMNEKMK